MHRPTYFSGHLSHTNNLCQVQREEIIISTAQQNSLKLKPAVKTAKTAGLVCSKDVGGTQVELRLSLPHPNRKVFAIKKKT